MRVFFLIGVILTFYGLAKHRNTTLPQIPQAPQSLSQEASLKTQDFERKLAAFYSSSEWLRRCSVEIDTRITGKTPSAVIPWRNDVQYLTSSWAFGLNLTSIAMAKSSPRPVAITPRHLVSTKHYGWHPKPGQTLRFLTLNNQIVSRTVDRIKYLGSSDNTDFEKDVAVIRLTEDLPESITPMKLIAPNGHADVVQYSCPILRIDQENKALLVQASWRSMSTKINFISPSSNGTPSAKSKSYAPYYEPMITGDSSSPSILLYRDQFGVTPFLVSQVTYAGEGMGPGLTNLAWEIQDIIKGFGDTHSKYLLSFGPYEFTGNAPPSCSISAAREGSTNQCNLTVRRTGGVASGNPNISPSSPSSWVKTGADIWTGKAFCSTASSAVFTATLSGPGGVGTACSSNRVPSVNLAPSCSMSASRINASASCLLSVSIFGESSGAPTVNPSPTTGWTQNGNVWTARANCPVGKTTSFNATVRGPYGTSYCGAGI